MTDLKDKVAVVTGGASGIGLATAKAFLAKGAKVVIGDYNEDSGKAVEQQLKETFENVLFVRTDVADEQSVENLVKTAVDKFGQLDIIFNNAGIGIQKPTHELTDDEYKRVIAVNQDGVFYGIKYALREMLKTGGGAIINTSSILGTVGEPTSIPYAASKGAVNLITKSVALEYADRNIRVNAVAPGFIESGLVNKESLGDFYDGLVAKHPVGRLGNPEEIAHAVVFLAENDFVTGTTIHVDGGYTAK
ncbi:SDR family oxidoreductase [Psychrobacillus psychrodurans]|uniref:SDR family NAD(P)-dependent oxidoreductase n=1 Tax=Psychrobacillus TaxID=1221880 RepID=UPI0008F164F5|nr:SDR family NAD(P)-dependent oxidoreductase [Psychrobacillus psychrodurans]MCK1999093.1 SDR family oxidoreductase [Psychrobacillus psychrodurans]MCZ8541346.1 SDR family oxidoreductase [Psychrobacillus psychrodurans]SFM96728.1 NAD(P)-dependent dehydrogenase, short-chain alcohol dehydrogenase family [Psychrobacillus psychrodurans]